MVSRRDEYLLAEASEGTGYDLGDRFDSEADVRQYFTPDEQVTMFGDQAITDAELLSEWAETVIRTRSHCAF